MSLFLTCMSEDIDIIAKVDSLSSPVSESTDYGYSRGPQHQHMPRASEWSPVAGQITEIKTALCHHSTGHRCHHNSSKQHGPRTSTWLLGRYGSHTPMPYPVVAWPMYINGHSSTTQTMDMDMAFRGNMIHDINMIASGRTDHRHLSGP